MNSRNSSGGELKWITVRFLAALLLVWLASGGHVFGQGGRTLPNSDPHTFHSDSVDGIDWSLSMTVFWTNYDSIYVRSILTNNSHQAIRFEIEDESSGPMLILRKKGEPAIRKQFDLRRYPRELSLRRNSLPGQPFCEFAVDLRRYFGKLEPGNYTIQFVWPKAGFSIGNYPSYKPRDMASPIGRFEVTATSLKHPVELWGELAQGNPKSPVSFTLKPTTPSDGRGESGFRSGLLKNGSRSTIFIPVYKLPLEGQPRESPAKIAIRAKVGWRKWHPDADSILRQIPDLSNRQLLYALAPGKSVRINLPDIFLGLDGMYSYSVPTFTSHTTTISKRDNFYHADDLDFSRGHVKFTSWLIIDRVRPLEVNAAEKTKHIGDNGHCAQE